MLTIGLYTKKTKITPDNDGRGERHFYYPCGNADIPKLIPVYTRIVDGVEEIYDYDETFSKEAGHYGLVKREVGNSAKLTPYGGV